jgi:hypothetical protein
MRNLSFSYGAGVYGITEVYTVSSALKLCIGEWEA